MHLLIRSLLYEESNLLLYKRQPMKYLFAILSISILVGCTEKPMSEEQREALKKEKKERAIRKISDAEILIEIKKQGRSYVGNSLETNSKVNSKIKTIWLSYDGDTSNIESDVFELFEAYRYSKKNGVMADEHAEDLGRGKLLYAAPKENGVWFIYFDRTKLIRNMY